MIFSSNAHQFLSNHFSENMTELSRWIDTYVFSVRPILDFRQREYLFFLQMKFFLLFLASEFNVWHGKRDATDTKHGSTEEIQQRSVINTGEVGQPINFGFSSAAGSHCHPHLSALRRRFSALLSGAKETMGVEVQELSRQGSLLACWELANHFLQLVLSLGHHLQHVC